MTAADALNRALCAAPTGPLAVAVSGGGDSVALLCLLTDWGQRPLIAATVDHQLRPESRAEAEAVARLCKKLGISHDILTWTDPDGPGNLQDRARMARRRLLANWASAKGAGAVVLGHTLDDQAETVLMRLARGSGVDGLGGMYATSTADGMTWLRPLLGVSRQDLRYVLRARGTPWVDDPSNADPRFARIRMRQLMPTLSKEGLDAETLAATAERMQMTRAVLDDAAAALAGAAVTLSELGYARLDLPLWRAARRETRLRVLSAILNWTAAQSYRPRLRDLTRIEDMLLAEQLGVRTLHGCMVRSKGGEATICREPAATGSELPVGAIWDDKWKTGGPPGAVVRALGESGLAMCKDWRETGHPREALLASPAIWYKDTLSCTAWAVKDAAFCLQLARPAQLCFTNSKGC
ncbi:tRNA lysidine(34) synthetase TilS [Halovulum sp. GXIMD14793]